MLLDFIKNGLENTDSGLGNRSTYIGSSDIGQCPKKSFLSKTKGESYNLEQLLIFQRGHVAEGIVRNGLKNNSTAKVNFEEQVEICGLGEIDFIKTHIDFVVDFPNEKLVIECKTISSPLPNNSPRESWVYQVQSQMALLQQSTNKQVRGKIVAFNLNSGEALEFDVEFNQALFDVAKQRASHIWNSLKSNTEPDGEVSDLCAYCPFKGKCSSLRAEAQELPKELSDAVKKLQEIKVAAKEEKSIKENIKAFMQASGMKKGVAGDYTVSVSKRKGSSKVNINVLKEDYPDIANAVIDEGLPTFALKIS